QWEAVQVALHEEVGRLPAAMRTAFVLCGLGDRPLKDAAADLGRTPGAVAGLLARARARLTERLTGRGFLAGVAAAVTGSAGPAVSAGLMRKAAAIQSAAEVSAAVSQLAQGVTGMAIHKAKLFALGLVAAGGLTAGLFAQPPGPKTPDSNNPFGPGRDDPKGAVAWFQDRLAAGKPADDADPKAAVERAKADLDRAQADYEAAVRAVERATRRSKFEYEPLLTPPTAAQFEGAVAAREAAGWEYVGTQEMTLTADDFTSPRLRELFAGKGKRATTVMVFRRAAGGVHGHRVNPTGGVYGFESRFNPTGGVHGLTFDRFDGQPGSQAK
ncbi:MAG: hypothetical protein K2X82_20180, partial [Gemmataceae bacterium]|nr:hypothetical protein [Gemmataceae bacterium]